MIYFDNAATTFPKPQCVYDAVNEGMQKYSFNAGRGSYLQAKETFEMIQDTRKKVASLISCDPNQVVFTSSATESLNLIINGLGLTKEDTVFVSPFEHNAIIRPLYNLGVNIQIIPFNKDDWSLDVEKLNDMFAVYKPKAVMISHISNVTGYMLPYETIFEIAKYYGVVTVLDSAQGFGVYGVNKYNIDFVVFAGHKSLYSVFGVAGIINLSHYTLNIVKAGGTGSDSLNPSMPENTPIRMEAGSLNSVAIYALNKSIDYLQTNDFKREKEILTQYLISKLKEIDGVVVYCPEKVITKGIVSFNIEGYTADDVGKILSSQYEVCVRTGFHCAPYIHDFIDDKDYSGCVRVSIGIFNNREEIDNLIEVLKEMVL